MSITGPEACTVFCGTADPALVVSTLQQHFEVDAGLGDWTRLELSGAAGSMVVTRRMFAPASPFSDTILGAHNAFRSGAEVRPGARDEVLHLLEVCDMMLGVRFDPDLRPDDPRADAVHAVATATKGLIFDRDVMLDAAGEPLVTVG